LSPDSSGGKEVKRSTKWFLVAMIAFAFLPACQSQEQKDGELVQAVLRRDEETGAKLLGRGANPNQFTEDGTPLLTVAVSIYSEPLIEALLQANADVNLKSRTLKNVSRVEGWNALIEAASGFCPASAVARLLAAGADPNIRTSSGNTALMSLGDPRTIEGLDKARVLVSSGADVSILNNDGQTALMLAASEGNAELIRFLGASDTDINRKNRSLGATPLMQGASRGSVETVQVLLDLGADLEVRDNEGRTALMYAASNGTDDVVTLLLEAGADTSAVDKYGRTALSIAEAQGWRTIASALRLSESRQSNSVRSKPRS
jgi:ankyrin repeat protein